MFVHIFRLLFLILIVRLSIKMLFLQPPLLLFLFLKITLLLFLFVLNRLYLIGYYSLLSTDKLSILFLSFDKDLLLELRYLVYRYWLECNRRLSILTDQITIMMRINMGRLNLLVIVFLVLIETEYLFLDLIFVYCIVSALLHL